MISEKSLSQLRSIGAKKILIQVPEGLKTKLLAFADFLSSRGFEPTVSIEPMFGACDLRDYEAKELGCDALLHIGHADFGVKPKLPVVYEPYEIVFDPVPLLKKHLEKLDAYKKICLTTTVNFQGALKPAQEFLKENGKKIFLGTQSRSGGAGTILGCDWSAAKPLEPTVDCFLYLGSGVFHPRGLALAVGKPVLALDYETGELVNYEQERKKFLSLQAFHLSEARDATTFGLLVSVKPGQNYSALAGRLKQLLEKKGKKAYLLAADFLSPEKLLGLKLDVLVNCACPRMNEDSKMFKKPILNPEDVMVLYRPCAGESSS